jgi:hypothetical protein
MFGWSFMSEETVDLISRVIQAHCVSLQTEMVRADLESLVTTHNKPNLACCLVFE